MRGQIGGRSCAIQPPRHDDLPPRQSVLRLLDTVDDDTKECQVWADIDIEGPPVWSKVAIIEEQRNVSRVVKTTLAISMRQRRSVNRPGYTRPVVSIS
jgi:hypothetical protein